MSGVLNTGSSNYILLKMNSAASETGAINTQLHETWSAPATLSEQIYYVVIIPCDYRVTLAKNTVNRAARQ
jgi:hypothetical protein